jgi:hypothetical protein
MVRPSRIVWSRSIAHAAGMSSRVDASLQQAGELVLQILHACLCHLSRLTLECLALLGYMNAAATYTVEEGKIVKMTFVWQPRTQK